MRCEQCDNELLSRAVYCPRCGTQVEGIEEREEYEYEAFISYRHLPKQRRVALQIQRKLEGAPIPKELQREGGPERLGRFFRDEDELTAAASLSDNIVRALEQSRYLIVLCTPETRESAWVLREVETFAALHGRDRIMAVLIEGEPEESFPPLLLSRVEFNEDSGTYEEVPADPLAADLRSRDPKRRQREMMRLEAPLLGCGLDDLMRRVHVRKLRRSLAISAVALAVLLACLVAAVIGGLMVLGSLRLSNISESSALVHEAADLLEQGNRIDALRVSLSALPQEGDTIARPFVAAAQLSLERTLGVFPSDTPWSCRYLVHAEGVGYDSKGPLQAIGMTGSAVEVSTIATGSRLFLVTPEDTGIGDPSMQLSGFRLGGETLLCLYGSHVACASLDDGSVQWTAELPAAHACYEVLYLGQTGEYALLSSPVEESVDDSLVVSFYDELSGKLVQTIELSELPSSPGASQSYLRCSLDEHSFAVATSDPDDAANLVTFERTASASEPQPQTSKLAHPMVRDLAYVGDSLVVATVDVADGLQDSSAAFECFDRSLARVWTSETTLNPYLDDRGIPSEQTLQILGAARGSDATPLVVFVCGDSLCCVSMRTGELLHTVSEPETIARAYLLSAADELPTVVGCTNDGILFKRTLLAQYHQGEKVLTCPTGQSASTAHLLYVDGRFDGLALWSSDTSCYRIFAFDSLSSYDVPAQLNATTVSCEDKGTALIGFGEGFDAVSLIDPNSFEPLWRTSLADIGWQDVGEVASNLGSSSVVLCATVQGGESLQRLVAELSLEDGSLVNAFAVDAGLSEEMWSSARNLLAWTDYFETSQGRRLFLMASLEDVVVADLDTHEVLFRKSTEADDYTMLDGAWLSDHAVIVRYERGDHKEVVRHSLSDNDSSGTLLARQMLGEVSRPALLGESRSIVAIRCHDGVIRAYDLDRCVQRWEAQGVPRNAQFLAAAGEWRLLMQDSLGALHLIDGTNGRARTESEILLPDISSCSRVSDDGQYAVLDYAPGSMGLVVVSLDDEAFGPISETRYGVFLSADATKVLATPPWAEGYRVYARYELADLMDRAYTVVDDFDLLNE